MNMDYDPPCRTPGKTPGRKNKGPQLDRFIPNRSALDIDVAHFNLTNNENCGFGGNNNAQNANGCPELQSPSKEEYKRRLAEGLMNVSDPSASRVLSFKAKAPAPPEGFEPSLNGLYTANAAPRPARKQFRNVPTAPERILDAPDIIDDYYLNSLDWSSSNMVSVALGNTVYLWNAASGEIAELMRCRGADDYVCSVSWAADGRHVAVGLSNAETQIWDATRAKQIRSLAGHSNRVSSMSWNGHMLSTGGRDSLIVNHDVRIREHVQGVLQGHQQEVCGLRWSPSGQQLASGGNDNLLCIWDAASAATQGAAPTHRLDSHQAAVKALAWCPFQGNLLASGGGTADRCIKFWNTHTGALLQSVDTGSQVCALQWNRHERELLSSHGFSQNQLCLWKYPSMVKVAELTGHTQRVLHMAQSPDGFSVVSAGADETLRFWKPFGEPAPVVKAKAGPEINSVLRSITLR